MIDSEHILSGNIKKPYSTTNIYKTIENTVVDQDISQQSNNNQDRTKLYLTKISISKPNRNNSIQHMDKKKVTKKIIPNNSFSEFTFPKLPSHTKQKHWSILLSNTPIKTNKVPTIATIHNTRHHQQENTNIQKYLFSSYYVRKKYIIII